MQVIKRKTEQYEPPLFANSHAALIFAFYYGLQQSPPSIMNALMNPPTESGKGLAGVDGAAQAGMIKNEIQKIGKVGMSIITARFAPKTIACECGSLCCSGFKANKDWVNAIAYLSDHVRSTALAGCVSNGLLRREYVVRYFSAEKQRTSLEQIAKKHEVSINTVSAHNQKVFQLLGGIRRGKHRAGGLEDAALAAIEDICQGQGWVEK